MKQIIAISILLTSCAVFVEDNRKSVKPWLHNYDNFKLQLSASYETFSASSRLVLSRKVSNLDTLENCMSHKPGDTKDPYLNNILCQTYFEIVQSSKRKIPLARNLDSAQKGKILKIKYEISEPGTFLEKTWRWANAVTLAIIPLRSKRNFDLKAELIIDGKKVKTYFLHDEMVEWVSILLLPAYPFFDGYALGTHKAMSNLLSGLLRQLHDDGYV